MQRRCAQTQDLGMEVVGCSLPHEWIFLEWFLILRLLYGEGNCMPVESIPTLLMLAGLPGTGKSTLAAALAQRLRWPIIDKDVVNTVLLGGDIAQAQAATLAYEVALTLTATFVVQQRLSVILDTAGRQPFILERATTIAHMAGGRLVVIRCVAPHQQRQARLSSRRAGPSQWTQDSTTAEQEARWYAHLPADTLLVSSDQAVECMLAAVLPSLQP